VSGHQIRLEQSNKSATDSACDFQTRRGGLKAGGLCTNLNSARRSFGTDDYYACAMKGSVVGLAEAGDVFGIGAANG
jgi:hypothetical protein